MGLLVVLTIVLVLFTISVAFILEERKSVVIDVKEYTDDVNTLFDDNDDDLI